MNRYKSGGPSQATATTRCQKCLKYGHYSYECTAAQQDRPYTSRPSRTQQILNPKLAPEITEAKLKIEESAPKRITAADTELGRKRRLDDPKSPRKRSRSPSTSSSDSVSTISTNRSRSMSRSPRRKRGLSRSRSPNRDSETRYRRRSTQRNQKPAPRRSRSPSPDEPHPQRRIDNRRAYSRSRSRSLERTDKYATRQRSRIPFREDREMPGHDYAQRLQEVSKSNPTTGGTGRRSLSPYSNRLALTKSMTDGS